MLQRYIQKIQHISERIRTYKNWYALVWPFTSRSSRVRVVRMRCGACLYVRDIFGPDFVVMHEMFARDDYGLRTAGLSAEQPVIIDVGANIGAFSALAAHQYKQAHIFAYEPDKKNFSTLLVNRALNSPEGNIRPFCQAVAAAAGESDFFLSSNAYDHSLLYEQVDTVVTKEKVLCTTLQDIIGEHDLAAVHFLKIDIEGAEYEALFATPDDIYKKIHYIALEIHKHPKYNRKQLLQFLERRGFAMRQSLTNGSVFFGGKL